MQHSTRIIRTSSLAIAVTLACPAIATAQASDLIITGVVDGPLTGGIPKAIEFYAIADIPDLSIYGWGSANNGGGTDGQEFTFPAISATAGDFIYVASEAPGFTSFFGFGPDYTSSAALINGDDAIELFRNGTVVDLFGEIDVDGTGTAWDHVDGWAYRVNGTGPDGSTFALANWTFSGPNALDGESDNDSAATPFPLGTYSTSGSGGGPTVPVSRCGLPATGIHDVQGSGFSTPIDGTTVEIEGVVVGDFQGSDELSGFFVQEEDSDVDADPNTSEGIFVFSRVLDVSVGDVVRVEGRADEFFGLTQLTGVSDIEVCASGAVVTPAEPVFPIASNADLERFEGMSVVFTQPLFVTDNFNLGRFGEVVLSIEGRQFNPTQVAEPGPDAVALADLNQRSRILLDDGTNRQNPIPVPPYFAADGTLRAGDEVANLTGVLSFGFSAYRVQPTGPVVFQRLNERDELPPPTSGRIDVAAFNVLNYFVTLDNAGPICGPSGNQDCRGADDAAELQRQRDKIVETLVRMSSDVVGLIELQNDQGASTQDLIDGINAVLGAGTYDFINTGFIGTDAIKVGIIYKPATVTPVGAHAILDSSVDPRFIDTKNRPVLAQTFEEVRSGERFTVAVNHLKSKGSDCEDVGDPDQNDGQGNCNGTRTLAVQALTDWLKKDPTGSKDPDFLIIGDLNSYANEDPIDAAIAAGYADLARVFSKKGEVPYTYTFFGEAGTLDYALANPTMKAQVTGVVEWHVNADEPRALDYNDFNQPSLYNPDPFRGSDHDPIIVGLKLIPQCEGKNATVYVGIDGVVVGGFGDGHPHRGALLGSFDDDVIVGTDGRDVILGLFGDDRICGLGGRDQLIGGFGDDTLFGGDGRDVLLGGFGDDNLDGGADRDVCQGGWGWNKQTNCER